MNALESHGRFCIQQTQARYEVDEWPICYRHHPQAPLAMASLALISGMLDDLPDDASDRELVAAAEHGASLISCGVLTKRDWEIGCVEVFDELERAFLKTTGGKG